MTFRSAAEARTLGASLVRLFVTALARNPSPAELSPNLERLRAGDDLGDVAAVLAAGDEFLSRHGPDGPPDHHYVRALFWAVDGQDPPETESQRLLAQAAPSRASLLVQVSQSATARAAITVEGTYYGGALRPEDDVAYQLWLEAGGETEPGSEGEVPPVTVTIVITASESRPDLLDETLASLVAQTSPHWQALVIGGGGIPARVEDARIRTIQPAEPTAEAMTRAAALAIGSLVGFIAASDLLAPGAVEAAARRYAAVPGTRLIYTDEDRVGGDGTRSGAVLKDGWNPDLLLSGDALGQLVLFDREALLASGGLSAAAGEFTLHDAALRLSHGAAPGQVVHQPGILFHRGRAQTGRPAPFPRTRAGNGAAALDAVIDRFLAAHDPGLRRTERRQGNQAWPAIAAALPSPAPRVSVIVPTRDKAALLEKCLSGLLRDTDYPDIEVLIVDNGSTEADATALLDRLATDSRIRVLRDDAPFNWSALNNRAAAAATGDILLLLNNDVSVIDPGWLRSMAGHASRQDVGVVGARLLFPDGTLQHGGMVLGPHGSAVHVMTGAAAADPGYLGHVALLRDVAAVTGACLAIRRSVFQQLGGLEQDHLRVAWSDVDLCLRAREAGYRVVWDPAATLVHHEMATRGRDISLEQQARHEIERLYMRRRWPGAMQHDPLLNPALQAQQGALLLQRAHGPAVAGDTMEDLQLELARLKRDLHLSEKDAERLRGLWPRAELQRLHLEATARTAEVAQLRQQNESLASALHGIPAYVLAFGRRLRLLGRVRWLIRRVIGAVKRTPERRVLLRQRRADYRMIAASPLFDRAWYRATAMDGDKGTDPVAHYLWRGAVAGSSPAALFDAGWYAARTPELGIESPFAHYIRCGMAADADPHPLFDVAFYIAQAPEAAGRALLHYGSLPQGDTRSPTAGFDPVDYPEGLVHWIQTGASQDRDPHALFAAAWYRHAHLGGSRAQDPLAHWVRQGRIAGLPANPYGLDPGVASRLPSAGGTPDVSLIVAGGSNPMETSRSLMSIAQHSAGAVYETILVASGPLPRHGDGLRTAPDRAAAVRAARAPLLVLLGAGTVVHAGWLQPLIAAASEPGVALVGCKTLRPDGSLRSAGAIVLEDGRARHETGGDPADPRHAFSRQTDSVDPAAMLVRTAAWNTLGGLQDGYRTDAAAVTDLALAAQARGWRVMVQPASQVSVLQEPDPESEDDLARLRRRWTAALSLQPPAWAEPGWRSVTRRVLVLVDAVPEPDGAGPAAEAVSRLVDEAGIRVALHALAAPAPATAAAWEQRGLEILRRPVSFDDWLRTHGPSLDEVWSFRAPCSASAAALLRWTGAALLQRAPDNNPPPRHDGALAMETADDRAAV